MTRERRGSAFPRRPTRKRRFSARVVIPRCIFMYMPNRAPTERLTVDNAAFAKPCSRVISYRRRSISMARLIARICNASHLYWDDSKASSRWHWVKSESRLSLIVFFFSFTGTGPGLTVARPRGVNFFYTRARTFFHLWRWSYYRYAIHEDYLIFRIYRCIRYFWKRVYSLCQECLSLSEISRIFIGEVFFKEFFTFPISRKKLSKFWKRH